MKVLNIFISINNIFKHIAVLDVKLVMRYNLERFRLCG